MVQDGSRLRELLEAAVSALGYELVGVELHSQSRHSLLRVYIDRAEGISVDDCERVSHQVSGVLDVEDPIRGSYTLEVSSPGLDRPLFTAEQFQRFAGHRVRIRLRIPLEGRRKFTGILRGMIDEDVLIDEDGQEWRLPAERIERARLVPEL